MPSVLLFLVLGSAIISLVWERSCRARIGLAVALRAVSFAAVAAWFTLERPLDMPTALFVEYSLGIAVLASAFAVAALRSTWRIDRSVAIAQMLLAGALLAFELRG